MTDSFSTLLISKDRSFQMPDTHFDRAQLIRYVSLNFTSGANDTNNPGQERTVLAVLAKSSTPISQDGGTGGASCGVQHLVTGTSGTSSRELCPVVVVLVFSLH